MIELHKKEYLHNDDNNNNKKESFLRYICCS